MENFKLEGKNIKFEFDKALEKVDFDIEVFEEMLKHCADLSSTLQRGIIETI